MTKTLLFVAAADFFFVSHRMTLARAARAAGYDVVVATHVAEHRAAIEAEGFRVVPIRIRRGLRNPFADLLALFDLLKAVRDECPDLVHLLSLKPVVFGGLAARLAGVPATINALTGLGFLYAEGAGSGGLLRTAVTRVLRFLAAPKNVWTIVQNADDLRTLADAKIGDPKRTVLIRGSGVDIVGFAPRPEPEGTPVAAMVSRLVGLKGVTDLVEAARLLRRRNVPIRVALVGSPDPLNPTAVSRETVEGWVAEGAVEWWGQRNDIPTVWAEAHIAVQPSRGGEGLPKSLLEAGACGRPLVTTDVPGCRELVSDGINGLVVPPQSPQALAAALEKLALDAALRKRLGAAARATVETEHADTAVAAATLDLYRRSLSA